MNIVPFGSTCKLQNGRAFKPTEWSSEGTPIVRIQNLNDESKPFNYCNFEVEERFHIKTGDLLFSWSGTPGTSFGAFFWNRGRGFLNQHIFRVDIDESEVDKNYLRYAINSKLSFIIDQAHGGVGLKHITKGKLEAIEIPLPPLKEQKRIAAILDKADAIRRKRQQAIKLTDDFLRSVFLDMFGDPVSNPKGWEVKALGSHLNAIESGASPKCESRPAQVGEWGVLKLGAVSYCKYVPSENKAIFHDYEPNPKNEIKKGDFLFTRKNTHELVAASALVENTLPKMLMPDLIFRLQTKNSLNRFYLWALLTHSGMRKKVQSYASGAAGSMPNISKANLRAIEIPVPPIEQQNRFRAIYQNVSNISHKINGSTEHIENQFFSLSQKSFSGKL